MSRSAFRRLPVKPRTPVNMRSSCAAFPVDQVLQDFLFSLLNAAQVKLGRRDARLLIDVTAVAAHEHARPHLRRGELAGQIDEALGQLRMAQVRAENREASQQGQREENDLGTAPGTAIELGPGRLNGASQYAPAADVSVWRRWRGRARSREATTPRPPRA